MDNEWKLKMALGKVPVVPLHHANDFTMWQLAIRRLVTTYNMADALLYSVPSNQLQNYRVAAPSATTTTTAPVAASREQPQPQPRDASVTTTTTPTRDEPRERTRIADGEDMDDAPHASSSGDERHIRAHDVVHSGARGTDFTTPASLTSPITSSGNTTGILGAPTLPAPAQALLGVRLR